MFVLGKITNDFDVNDSLLDLHTSKFMETNKNLIKNETDNKNNVFDRIKREVRTLSSRTPLRALLVVNYIDPGRWHTVNGQGTEPLSIL